MNEEHIILEKAVRSALSGKDAHVQADKALTGLSWKVAGRKPDGVSHSIYQLVNHMAYWQEWAVKWLDGKSPPVPKHASGSWPGRVSPATARDWAQAVGRFKRCLKELDRRSCEENLFSKQSRKSRLEMIQTIALHDSYHLGQVALVRQILGVWPPPSGGVTW